jgi:hypothetical protein
MSKGGKRVRVKGGKKGLRVGKGKG